jgi:cell division protein ZapA (FtsZ GTPase activity inhibitor)
MTESALAPPDPACGETPMCDQCQQLEAKILHFRQFLRQRFDPLTEERIKAMIAELEQRKEAMH